MRRFVFSILILLYGYSLLAQNIHLVSVGVSDYPGYQNDLKLPAVDAQSVRSLYKKNSKTASTYLYTNSRATKESVLVALKRVASQCKEGDVFTFYFSGHGYPGGFVLYDDNLTYEEIAEVCALSPAKRKIIFADACFAGGLRDEKPSTISIDNDWDLMLLLSSRTDEYSIEGLWDKNGKFTLCLLRSLKGGADTNKDRIITAKELFIAVRKGVVALTDDQQHPVMWGNFEDNMPVMIW